MNRLRKGRNKSPVRGAGEATAARASRPAGGLCDSDSSLPIRLFDALYRRWGPQHWWPAETPFEVMVGAILTQNTAWANVEKAIERLRARRLLRPRTLAALPDAELVELIRPAGCPRVKTQRLRAFLTRFLADHGGSVASLHPLPTPDLRKWLLAIPGIGPETADSILLYALDRPVFVVDAYTRRALTRHGWVDGRASYDAIARFFTDRLLRDTALFREYHALIVRLGKERCRPRPLCSDCPWRPWLPEGGPAA